MGSFHWEKRKSRRVKDTILLGISKKNEAKRSMIKKTRR